MLTGWLERRKKVIKNGKEKTEEFESRHRILESAKREFAERGFQGARMAEIARKARVNKALIHYYYTSKEMLYFEVIKNIFGDQKTDADIPVYTGNIDFSPSQKLYIMLYFLVYSHLRGADPETIRIFFWEVAEGEKYLSHFMEKYTAPRHRRLLEIIKEGIEKGQFETINPELSVVAIFSFITFYTVDIKLSGGENRFFFSDSSTDVNDVAEFIIKNTFKALQPPGRTFSLPSIPSDFMAYVDRLLELHLLRQKDEGIMALVTRQLEEMIM